MRNFLRNWAILAGLVLALVVVLPEPMRLIFGLFHGLGIVPVALLLVILAVLPGRVSRPRVSKPALHSHSLNLTDKI